MTNGIGQSRLFFCPSLSCLLVGPPGGRELPAIELGQQHRSRTRTFAEWLFGNIISFIENGSAFLCQRARAFFMFLNRIIIVFPRYIYNEEQCKHQNNNASYNGITIKSSANIIIMRLPTMTSSMHRSRFGISEVSWNYYYYICLSFHKTAIGCIISPMYGWREKLQER